MDGVLSDEPLLTLVADVDADLDQLSDVEIVTALAELETHRRRLAVLDHRLGAQVMSRQIGKVITEDHLACLLASTLRLSRREARERAAHTIDLGPRFTLQGDPLPPILSGCADAVEDGAISAEHVQIIRRTLDKIPAHLAWDISENAEMLLVAAARTQTPRHLQRTADLLLFELDPDGREPSDEQLDAHRGVTLRRYHDGVHDGMTELRGWLTPETAALWDTIFDTLAAPCHRISNGTYTDDDAGSDTSERDERSPAQRRHDALRDAAQRLLRSGTLPDTGGTPVTLLIRVNDVDLPGQRVGDTDRASDTSGSNDLSRGDIATHTAVAGMSGRRTGRGCGFGLTEHGQLIRLERVTRLGLAEADLIPVHVDRRGAILDLGRTRRLASCAQRRALTVRDGGCCFPGCERPATWCQVHHVIAWIDGGRTDVANMCLLCPHHHAAFASAGWSLRMRDGVPEWTPPSWHDPHQRPVRNTVHHPPDITFRQPVPTRA